jgi:hypothetical protein
MKHGSARCLQRNKRTATVTEVQMRSLARRGDADFSDISVHRRLYRVTVRLSALTAATDYMSVLR